MSEKSVPGSAGVEDSGGSGIVGIFFLSQLTDLASDGYGLGSNL